MSEKNIIIWGDSILKGVAFDEAEGKYKVMENNCIKRLGEITGNNISNNAYFGMTSTKAINRIISALKRNPPDKGDTVIIELGGNDCDFNWSEVATDPAKPHQPNTPINCFKNTLQQIIDQFKEKGLNPILMNLPPLEPQLYFNWISKGLNSENIIKWLGDVAHIYRWQEAYNSAVMWLAQKNCCQLINVRENFLLSHDYKSLFCIDGIHPNEKGHERILEALLQFGF